VRNLLLNDAVMRSVNECEDVKRPSSVITLTKNETVRCRSTNCRCV